MDAAYQQKLKNIKKHKIKQWKARKKARVAEERQKERRDRFIESLRQTGDLKVAYHTSRTEIPRIIKVRYHLSFSLKFTIIVSYCKNILITMHEELSETDLECNRKIVCQGHSTKRYAKAHFLFP